jgi:hypothetical protein
MDDHLVTVEWGLYRQFEPGAYGPLQQLPRREARAVHTRLMDQKNARIEELRALLRRNGLELGTSDPAIQDLNDWFQQEVEGEPADPGAMKHPWYGVATDIGLHLGDIMIARVPDLHWEFFTGGKKDISYQRTVIMGFSWIPNPKYNVDPQRLVVTYGHQIVTGDEFDGDAFWRWVKSVEFR